MRNIEAAREEYHLQGISLYGQMISAMNKSIIEDIEPPVTLEDGRHSVKLVEAIYKAVREKRVVSVD